MYAPDRRRFIFEQWPRKPKGPALGKPPPSGKRPPNQLVWGADLDSFFWTARFPGLNVLTVWTRSMIQEYGENYYDLEEINDYEPDPHLIPPYPLLHVIEEPDTKEDVDSHSESASEMDQDQVEGSDKGKGRAYDSDDSDDTVAVSAAPPALPIATFKPTMSVFKATERAFEMLPKLEEFIPDQHFPDILLVHDPDGLTPGAESQSSSRRSKRKNGAQAIEYKRVWPTFDRDTSTASGATTDTSDTNATAANPRTAHLYLSAKCRMGVGNHSLVYRAALTLPPPLIAESPTGQVTVAAKLAFPRPSARQMLHNEAYIYNKFPRHLMEDWSGYNLVTPHKYPVPVDAVVPKFFGYYVPVEPGQSSSDNDLSPILLVEECGKPVDTKDLSPDERSQCYTHIIRLHYENFMQNSVYVRNIMVQPGPLNYPPSERTLARPSFRIIDFGRGEWLDDWFRVVSGKRLSEVKDLETDNDFHSWRKKVTRQEKEARQELGGPLFD